MLRSTLPIPFLKSFEQKFKLDYLLNPAGIINTGPRSYLLASVGSHENVLLFGMQRFRKVQLTETPANPTKNFSIDDYMGSGAMQFGDGREISLKAALSENLASYLEETKLSENQKIRWKDGAYILSAKVKYSWQLCFWIRSQGSGITVLSPKFLRDEIFADAMKTMENYKAYSGQTPK